MTSKTSIARHDRRRRRRSIQYLVRIGAIDVLSPLYQRVLLPQTVARELHQNNTPATVRAWIAQPPTWCEIRSHPFTDPTLAFLDPGERAAISLALSFHADRFLIDDWDDRREAQRMQNNLRRYTHLKRT